MPILFCIFNSYVTPFCVWKTLFYWQKSKKLKSKFVPQTLFRFRVQFVSDFLERANRAQELDLFEAEFLVTRTFSIETM